MEIIKKGMEEMLTNHPNTMANTLNIMFTHQKLSKGYLPFLGTLLDRKGDGCVKLLVYRKKTHINQYLYFNSHHALHQKLGIVKTLIDR